MMEKLSLDKFEEAYERVQEVVLPTNLVQSDFFSQIRQEIKFILNRRIFSLPERIRFAELTIRSVH